jgi:hypothetical protein
MTTEETLESRSNQSYASMISEVLNQATPRHLDIQLDYLFNGITLENASVLEIGGGNGLYSFYAAYRGANTVVCLEPLADGSSQRANTEFTLLSTALDYRQLSYVPNTLQDYDAAGQRFHVILLQSSINHLDESACINLAHDVDAQQTYHVLFRKLYDLSHMNAKLIITDASRHNFFQAINRPNPFVPQTEWHKHQSPKRWISLLQSAGFTKCTLGWAPVKRLGAVGRVITANRLASYFLSSQFRIVMEKR